MEGVCPAGGLRKLGPVKVLHVAPSLAYEWGGSAKVVSELTENLSKMGVETTICASKEKGHEGAVYRPRGVRVKDFAESIFANLWTGFSVSLGRALHEQIINTDIVHIHEIWHYPHFAAYRAARRQKKPYIVTVHGMLDPWCLDHKKRRKKIYAHLFQRGILETASAIHALTKQEREQISAFVVHERIVVLPNGLNVEEYDPIPPRGEIEALYPELRGKGVVVFIGRLHPKKGLDVLVHAWGKVLRNPGRMRTVPHLLIVGPGEERYRSKLVELVRWEGVAGHVTFAGMLTGKEKLAALSRADVFVLSSHSEGFSMVVLEAMLCKTPVVISPQCNFPDVGLAEGGEVVESDPEELASALVRLLNNPELRTKMGENGARLVRERFAWRGIAAEMVELYRRILGE